MKISTFGERKENSVSISWTSSDILWQVSNCSSFHFFGHSVAKSSPEFVVLILKKDMLPHEVCQCSPHLSHWQLSVRLGPPLTGTNVRGNVTVLADSKFSPLFLLTDRIAHARLELCSFVSSQCVVPVGISKLLFEGTAFLFH